MPLQQRFSRWTASFNDGTFGQQRSVVRHNTATRPGENFYARIGGVPSHRRTLSCKCAHAGRTTPERQKKPHFRTFRIRRLVRACGGIRRARNAQGPVRPPRRGYNTAPIFTSNAVLGIAVPNDKARTPPRPPKPPPRLPGFPLVILPFRGGKLAQREEQQCGVDNRA
jgi:hypothetical protein